MSRLAVGAGLAAAVAACIYYWLYLAPQVSQTWNDTYEYIVGEFMHGFT